jgi:hypothetical protein
MHMHVHDEIEYAYTMHTTYVCMFIYFIYFIFYFICTVHTCSVRTVGRWEAKKKIFSLIVCAFIIQYLYSFLFFIFHFALYII